VQRSVLSVATFYCHLFLTLTCTATSFLVLPAQPPVVQLSQLSRLLNSSMLGRTMCFNSRAVCCLLSPSKLEGGPATEALEHFQRRNKRRHTGTAEYRGGSSKLDSFSFDKFFGDLSAEEFPSIAWDFAEDEDETCPLALKKSRPSSALLGVKRSRGNQSGLVRSKAFEADLSSLGNSQTFDELNTLSTTVEPLAHKSAALEEQQEVKPTSMIDVAFHSRSTPKSSPFFVANSRSNHLAGLAHFHDR